jgi:TldD protein
MKGERTLALLDSLPELAAAVSGLPRLVAELESRIPYAAASVARNVGLEVHVNHREQTVTERPPSQGLVLTAWNGEYFEEAASSDLTDDAMLHLARQLRDRVQIRQPAEALAPGTPLTANFATATQQDPRALSAKDKLDRCRSLHQRMRGLDPRIVNVQVQYSENLEVRAFANRVRQLAQSVLRLRLGVVLFVSDGQQMKYDWLTKEGTGGLELLNFSDADLHMLCERTVKLLSAERVPPGMYDVISTPDVSGVIAHEAFGHGVELDMFLKDRARSRQYLGKPVASPLVDILDDPSVPGAHGSYFFDDEGQLAAPTYIIRQGVFERGLSDMLSAHRLGVARSANGRRESFERKLYARMSNTFFASGTTPVTQLIESVDNGVYLQHSSSGMEDPKGWGMQVTSHYGEEIRNGKLTGRVFAPVGITGYVPDILQSISGVGSDMELSGGFCGKGHKEWAPVASGGPHLKLKARLG